MDLPSLEVLLLDDNRITRIERQAFKNMDLLKRLDLRGNKLMAISDEAFQNLPQLELLDLAYNQLQALDFSMLDQVSHTMQSHLRMFSMGPTLGCLFCSHAVINSSTQYLKGERRPFNGASSTVYV
jgi:Leucine-rich repeat (LRR) protein